MKAASNIPLPPSLFGLTRSELAALLDRPFRATQIYEAIYQRWAADFEGMTNLSKSLRSRLAEQLAIELPTIHRVFEAADGTRRYLLRLDDGEFAETVFIPDGDRNTICVSSQVGCALACAFCLTGQLGFTRHLTAAEIVSQILVAQRENIPYENRNHFNVVLMGMGEPLHNYSNVMRTLEILHDPDGLNMSMSRITLSTVGLLPELERLGNETLVPNLAVSLTGARDEIRDGLMPINRTYPIRDLVAALRRFPRRPRQKVTFEYVLLEGVTDSPGDAARLARLARSARARVNLIPLNEAPDLAFGRPADGAVARFQEALLKGGVRAFVRRSRGDDISAACGQLKRKWADQKPEIDLEALRLAD